MELLRSPGEAFEEEKILIPPLVNLTLEYSHPAYHWFDRWDRTRITRAIPEELREYALEFAEARDYAHLNIMTEAFPEVKTDEVLWAVLQNGDTMEFLLLTQATLRENSITHRMQYFFKYPPFANSFGKLRFELPYLLAAIQGNVDPILIDSLRNYHVFLDYPQILEAAIQYGTPETLNLVVNWVNSVPPDTVEMANKGLIVAAKAGNLNLVKEFVARGANDYNRAIYGTIEAQSSEVLNYLIEQGADNYDVMLEYAIENYPEIVPSLSASGKITSNGWWRGLRSAASKGYLEWVEAILPRFPDKELDEVLWEAVNSDQEEIARYLLKNYPTRISEWTRGKVLKEASKRGHPLS